MKFLENKFIFRGTLILILLLSVVLRLWRIDAPLADWHSWRQSDTAAVARNFLTFGFDPLRPRYDDLSNIQSGKDNPQGYRMVEFPLYQLIGAGVVRFIPLFSIEVGLRLITIASVAATTGLLVLMMSSLADPLTGILTGFVYAFLPYSIYFGRVILPEPFAVFWAMLSLYLLFQMGERGEKGKKQTWVWLVLGGCAGALALLVKPTVGFLLLPVPYLIWRRHGWSGHSLIRLFAYSLIAVLPFWAWRKWILQFPEGIPAFEWLLNDGNIRFKGAWFYWLFAKRIGELILGYWGILPFGIGLLVAPKNREGWFTRLLLLGTLLYLIVFAAGNVRHDYYQILLIPIVSMYVAKGFRFLLDNNVFSKAISYQLSAISLLFMLAFSWYTVRTYYWINRPEIVEAGKAADQLLPKDAKVIASYNGDTTFLYQINRQGWPLGFEIEKKIVSGATHYVTISPTDNDGETKDLASRYTVLVRNDRYAIIDLTRPKQ